MAKEQQSVEAELKDAASTDASTSEQADSTNKAAEPTTSVINADDFELDFNPDAFVERRQADSGENFVVYDADAVSSKNVRLASQYLREVVLRDFLVEAVASPLLSTDGFLISRTLHRKGINMRYLGQLVALIDSEGEKLEGPKAISKEETAFILNLLRANLVHEMVIRAAKHIVNHHLRAAGPYDAAGIVSHLFNCLLGSDFNEAPVPETADLPSDVSRAWTSVTPSSIRADVRREVAARFRFSLPDTWFSESMLKKKVLRELSLRIGVQLAARKYNFGTRSDTDTSTAETQQSRPQVNGSAHSSDVEPTVSSSLKKGKKGKKAKTAQAEAAHPRGEPTTFDAIDVLNVAPVIKATQHRSALVEDMFYQGQRAIHENQAEVGEALVNDALHLCEQIFGAVHPEAAEKYHALGIMWHNIAQRILKTLRTHDAAEQALRELPEADRAKYEQQVSNMLLPEPEAARADVEAYMNQAVRLVRQSIVISERTYGIDSADAITQYADLGLLEQQAGNVSVALQLTRHAMNLYVATYGPKHPQLVTLLVSEAGMFSARHGTLTCPHAIADERRRHGAVARWRRRRVATAGRGSQARRACLRPRLGRCRPSRARPRADARHAAGHHCRAQAHPARSRHPGEAPGRGVARGPGGVSVHQPRGADLCPRRAGAGCSRSSSTSASLTEWRCTSSLERLVPRRLRQAFGEWICCARRDTLGRSTAHAWREGAR